MILLEVELTQAYLLTFAVGGHYVTECQICDTGLQQCYITLP